MSLLFVAVAVLVGSGLLAVLCGRWALLASIVGAGGAVAGCAVGLVPAVTTIARGTTEQLYRAWDVPYGSFAVELDPLSALFLVPMLGLSGLAAVYGSQYLLAYRDRKSLGPPWFFFNVLVASMVMVVLARNAVLFLVSWEIMSLASYFLVTFEDEKPSVREAGRIYLIATHLGTAFLLAFFIIIQGHQTRPMEALDFAPMTGDAGTANLLFLLALIGFGTKAGFMPLHVWLPEAHPAAPSHVSAVMSGVMVKMGIYGLIRVLTLLPSAPAWWGSLLIGIGVVSGVWGISFALSQGDIKRTLAYSTVENVGIIALGLGSGLLGLSFDNAPLAVLGFAGALMHVVNHAMFKGLLFLGAGAVFHGTGTRQIDLLGGLSKRMPLVSIVFLVGVAAITAMPPLNGFMGEFLIYLGAFGEGELFKPAPAAAALAVIASLALIGGLAVITFTKVFGIAFLGAPRSQDAARAHSPGWFMTAPMVVLAAGCVAVGLAAPRLLLLLSPILSLMTRKPEAAFEAQMASAATSLAGIVLAGSILLGLIAGLAFLRFALLASREVTLSETWGCGYIRPTARMQYTASSYAQPAVDFFYMLLRTGKRLTPPRGLFPGEATMATETADVPHHYFYRPIFIAVEWLFSRLRWLQHGHAHLYVLYVGVTLVTLLIWYISRASN